ncbi:hypothetical protein [Senegalimassilia anaerobia]|uniref:hypothetical protein n=1 Tax=Senegalimassilia anaerobia TaxID=1473216 RepID=UPI0026F0E11B|nr:hypothetical protein [Senegalimassilia anaerobia]
MTEQNAHDDERDTADLATNDAADLAAGDATDLVTDDTADLAIDDTSDSAVDDASDLAAGDAADLATADAARSQPPAGQLTPAGRAVSPSPSPPPTFAATDRPARRARRLRWKPGITRPMMALSAASFALMIAGVGGYVSAIPAVVAGDKPSTVVMPLESALWLDGQMREVQAGPVGSTRAVGPVAIEASRVNAAAPDAASALGLGSGSGALGVASLTGATAISSVDSSFARAQQVAGGDSTASGSASTSASTSSGGSGSASGSGSGSSGGASDASGGTGGSGAGSGSESAGGSGSAPAPAGPTAEQEAAAYAVLVDHQARVNDYVARVNNAVAAFNNDCMSTSRPLRQSDYNECAAIDGQTLTDFLLLRNSDAFADGSRWLEQKGNLQRAYIALDQYLSVIYDAWGLNLAYENPAEGVDRWMEPVRADQDASGNSIAAARLNETLASIRL